MKKTISITLGGRAYLVEEDAYQELDAYLNRLKSHFSKDPSADELMTDIELSISDKFSERIHEQKTVISEQDVKEVITVMGQINEIEQEESTNGPREEKTTNAEATSSTRKRLYRDEDDMVVAGVCSGLAAYFGIDPVFLRVAFVLLAFANGVGILAYFILWVAVPVAETSAQKLEMQGRPVNLTEIEELMKEKAKLVTTEGKAAVERLKTTNSSFLQKALNIPVLVIGTLWRALQRTTQTIGPIISTLIGIFILLSSILALTGTSIVASILLFRKDAPELLTNIPLHPLTQTPWYTSGIIASSLLIGIPLIFLLILGVSCITRKNQFRVFASSVLLGLWMIAAGVASVAATHVGPQVHTHVEQYIREETATRRYEVSGFQQISVSGNKRITIKQGETFSVELHGLKNGLDQVNVTSEDGVLSIQERETQSRFCLFCLHRPVEGTITLPKLERLTASDISRVIIQEGKHDLFLQARDAAAIEATLNTAHVTTTLEDVARITLRGKVETLDITTKDASRLYADTLSTESIRAIQEDISRTELRGTTKTLEATLKEVARLDASELRANTVTLRTYDQARADVYPLQSLTATSSDVSRVHYEDTGASTTIRELDHARITSSEEG